MTIFRAASAEGGHWGLAAKSCLQRLGAVPEGANLGFVYVTEGFADTLSSIIVFLRETTSVDRWLGGVGYGVFGPEGERRGGSALGIMVGAVDAAAMHPFVRFDPADPVGFLEEHGPWLAQQTAVTALVHGNPHAPQIALAVAELATLGRAFLVGGLTAAGEAPSQVCGRVGDPPLSGILMGDGIVLATGLILRS